MAQLTNDCFAFGGDLMRAEAALAALGSRIGPVTATVAVPLVEAAGRILARDIVAGRSVPPHDNAAVDGFAVRAADLDPSGPTVLAVTGRVAAGVLGVSPAPGGAVRVFTGAAMPPGLDTVFMQEDVTLQPDGRVSLPAGLKPGSNRRRAGEDVAEGSTVLTIGARLRPQEIGLLASIGITEVPVFAALTVALMSTGDELREPGTATPPGTVYDANRVMLRAGLEALGCRVIDLGIVPDRLDAVEVALATAAAGADAIVTSGGVSTGEGDHVRTAVAAAGAIHFWRLAIRPGRPLAFGTAHGKAFIGLPGNPVAAYVCFLRFARPTLLRLAGQARVEPILYRVRAGFETGKKVGRREWLRCRLVSGPDGPVAERFPRDGAGIATSLVFADGLAEIAEEVDQVRVGDPLAFLPFPDV